MKAGDPRTTRIILYVAVAAIGFAAIEALPQSGRETRATASRSVLHAIAQVERVEPSLVSNDAFSSAILARQPRVPTELRGLRGSSGSEPLNPRMFGVLPDSGVGPTLKQPGGKPAAPESRGTTRQVERAVKRTILLTGIVTVGDPVALIAVDGKDSRTCRVGEQLGPGIKLLAIEDRGAVIGLEHQRKVIHLGQVTEL